MQANTMSKYRTVKKLIKQTLQKCKDKLPKQAKTLSKNQYEDEKKKKKKKKRESRRNR